MTPAPLPPRSRLRRTVRAGLVTLAVMVAAPILLVIFLHRLGAGTR